MKLPHVIRRKKMQTHIYKWHSRMYLEEKTYTPPLKNSIPTSNQKKKPTNPHMKKTHPHVIRKKKFSKPTLKNGVSVCKQKRGRSTHRRLPLPISPATRTRPLAMSPRRAIPPFSPLPLPFPSPPPSPLFLFPCFYF